MTNRLLIAHRDTVWCEVNQLFLTELGYEVETCHDGLECLGRIRRLEPALLVLDLDLPWGGGDGVLAWLRDMSATPRFPVLLVGHDAGESEIERLMVSPVVDYLPRLVGLIHLLDSIRSSFVTTEYRDPSKTNRVTRTHSFTSADKGY